jgi:hypothetical protein
VSAGAIPGSLGPRTLRHLGHALLARAQAMERTDPDRFAADRRELTPEGVERLAEIVAAGSRPSLGFFLRHRVEAP